MATNTPPAGGYQLGGWYNGQQWNGTAFTQPAGVNAIGSQAGQAVPDTVIAATNPNNVAYVHQQQQNYQPTTTTQVPNNNPASGSGSGNAMSGMTFGNAPTIDLNSITNAAYNTPEITAANQQMTTLNNQINERRTALNTAMAEINDNPFYSEATRTGKLSKLQTKADNDINTFINQQNQAQTTLQNLKADAAVKVNAATGQYNIENQAYQQNLSNFQSLVSAGGLANASATDIANYSVATGIPASMLTAISGKKNLDITYETDDAGNVTAIAIDKNTGEIVNKSTVSGVGKSTKSTAGETKADTEKAYTDYVTQHAKEGVTLGELVNAYQTGLSIEQILALYNQFSPNGHAKETLGQIKQGIFADQKGFVSG